MDQSVTSGKQNKSYLGYAAKSQNVTKLQRYLSTKNASTAVKNANKTLGKKSDILKNKRF